MWAELCAKDAEWPQGDDMLLTIFAVAEFFQGDEEKTKLWFNTPNPLLGGLSPVAMCRAGGVHKLLAFVQASTDANKAPSKSP